MMHRSIAFAAALILATCVAAAPAETAPAAPAAKPPAPKPPAAKAPISPEEMAARIQKHRTADVTLTVTDAAGKPLAGAAVTVGQVRHKFLFGCNIFKLDPAATTPEQKAYQDRYAALLNYATLPFYWGGFEPVQGKPATERLRAMAEWCRDHGIAVKGHPLCWHQARAKWLIGKPVEEVQTLQVARVARDVTAFKGLVDTWDVVNEAVIMPDFQRGGENPIAAWCKKVGRVEVLKATFAAARQANPGARLLYNDYDVSPKCEALIKEALDAGVTIDVVGIQSHMHSGFWGAEKAWQVAERFSKFGKPLHFTELTIISGEKRAWSNDANARATDWFTTPDGEQQQAQQVEEFYRVLFSHPAVEAITWWDFSDLGAWRGAPSGLVRKDMSPKPAYDTLMRLIKKEWWTAPQTLTTDAAGRVTFRGFMGEYEVTAGAAKGTLRLETAGAAEAAVSVK